MCIYYIYVTKNSKSKNFRFNDARFIQKLKSKNTNVEIVTRIKKKHFKPKNN